MVQGEIGGFPIICCHLYLQLNSVGVQQVCVSAGVCGSAGMCGSVKELIFPGIKILILTHPPIYW